MVPFLFLSGSERVANHLLELQSRQGFLSATRVYQLQLAISEAAWRENTSHWTPSLATNDCVIM